MPQIEHLQIDGVTYDIVGDATAINNKVNKTGDTMTGGLGYDFDLDMSYEYPDGADPLNDEDSVGGYSMLDSSRTMNCGLIAVRNNAWKLNGMRLQVTRHIDDLRFTNQLDINIDSNGDSKYFVSDPVAFRNALNASSGIWPLSVGGTGGADSGWKSLTNSSVFTGTIYYRKIGQWVEVSGYQIKLASELSTNNGIVLATIPSGYRPSKAIGMFAGNANLTYGLCTIVTGGDVKFYKGATASTYTTSSNIYFHGMYFI